MKPGSVCVAQRRIGQIICRQARSGSRFAIVFVTDRLAQNRITAGGITGDGKHVTVIGGHDDEGVTEIYLLQRRADSPRQFNSIQQRPLRIDRVMGMINAT